MYYNLEKQEEDYSKWDKFLLFFFKKIIKKHAITKNEDLKYYLEKLNPYTTKIWKSYQSGKGISPDYNNDNLREAYMIRYFHEYDLPMRYELYYAHSANNTALEVFYEKKN